jgi:hypothetical protein
MKQIILFAALILVSVTARADVFKCKTPNGMVYSEHPCANDATVVNNLAKKPSEEDVRAADARLENNIRQVEDNERQARQERQSREWQQATREITIAAPTRSRNTTIQSYRQNQNLYVPVPQTTSKASNNQSQINRLPR